MTDDPFDQQVQRYWPGGDPLSQAHHFLMSEQVDVALTVCRMELVDKTVLEDEMHQRHATLQRAAQEIQLLKQQLAQAQEERDNFLERLAIDAATIQRLQTENSQARTLLVEAESLLLSNASWEFIRARKARYSAFLAQLMEEADG